MTRHQYGISALDTQTSFCEGSSDDLARRRLFSQATSAITLQCSIAPFKSTHSLYIETDAGGGFDKLKTINSSRPANH